MFFETAILAVIANHAIAPASPTIRIALFLAHLSAKATDKIYKTKPINLDVAHSFTNGYTDKFTQSKITLIINTVSTMCGVIFSHFFCKLGDLRIRSTKRIRNKLNDKAIAVK